MKDLLRQAIETAVKRYPAVLPHLSADVFEALKHYGPGDHPGTGTSQDVHGDSGLTESGRKVIEKALAFTRKTDREYAFIVDKDGNVFYENKGTKSSVNTAPQQEVDKYPGHILYHTHPNGMTFSGTDILLFLDDKTAQSWRVVSNDGKIWEIVKTKDVTRSSVYNINEIIYAEWGPIDRQIAIDYGNDKITRDEAKSKTVKAYNETVIKVTSVRGLEIRIVHEHTD